MQSSSIEFLCTYSCMNKQQKALQKIGKLKLQSCDGSKFIRIEVSIAIQFLGNTGKAHLRNALRDEPIQQVCENIIVAQLRRIFWKGLRKRERSTTCKIWTIM